MRSRCVKVVYQWLMVQIECKSCVTVVAYVKKEKPTCTRPNHWEGRIFVVYESS